MSDARTGKRFPMELPITIHSTETNQDVKGLTSNLSAAGVYLRAEGPLEVGAQSEVLTGTIVKHLAQLGRYFEAKRQRLPADLGRELGDGERVEMLGHHASGVVSRPWPIICT